MTTRRAFLGALAGAVLAPISAGAQQPTKVWRIGYLHGAARTPDGAPPAALRQALQALGYVEGKDVTYVGRWAEAKRERLPGLAAELVDLKVDLIVTRGGPAAQAARQATTTIPIVISGAGDAVGTGLISSLAHPGGNITGISDQAAELSMTLRYREVERAARILRVTVQPLGVREPEDFDTAFAAMIRNRPDAFFLVTDALTTLNRKRIIDFAAAHRIPAMYEFDFLVRDGGLMSYGWDLDDNLRRAAVYVDKILKGAKPGDLPVEQPTRYYLLINLKTAKALGLTIPQSLLLRADEVIK